MMSWYHSAEGLAVSPFPFTLKWLESVLQQCPSEHEDARFSSIIPESASV